MMMNKGFKMLAALLFISFIYFKQYYFILVVLGVGFFIYKLRIHEKVYKVLNLVIGHNTNIRNSENERKRFIRKLSRQNKGGEI